MSALTRHIERLIGTDETVISEEAVVGWRLSLAFFGTASFFNGVALLLALYIWIINRQAHMKKTKGSHAGYKPHEDVGDEDGSDNDSVGAIRDMDGFEIEEEDNYDVSPRNKRISEEGLRRSSQWRRLMSDVRRSKAWESIMNFEVEKDDDADDDEMEKGDKRERHGSVQRSPPSTGRPSIGSFAEIVSKIKVFSYLGQDALKLCLNDAEYVDLEVGQHLFERGAFDGSLFVVLIGSVKCRFHDYPLRDEPHIATDPSEQSANDAANILSFISGSGTVVTPLLAMLEALVQHHRVACAADSDGTVSPRPLSMADGVSAVATENSRLIKIPARCYSMVLEKFPADVHRVAVTIVQRVQRVTLQTLVKTLGLHTELLRRGSAFESPEAWASRMAPPEWYHLASNLSDISNGSKTLGSAMKSLISDASVVAAAELELNPQCATTLEQHSTLISLSRGETLIQTGSPHHALYMVLSGEVEVGPEIPGTSQSFYRFNKLQPGALVGRLACFSGDVSIFSARAISDEVKLLRIPKTTIDDLMIARPRAMISCFERILGLLSPSVHLVNWCSQWNHVQASEVIARKGDPCDFMYMVLNGRIRASYSSNAGTAPEEFGRGRCIGDVGGITRSRWPCKVFAIRNSELAKVPVKVLEALIRVHPSAGLHFARVIASQIRARQSEQGLSSVSGRRRVYHRRGISVCTAPPTPSIAPSYGLSLATIAVVPLSSDIDVDAFCSTMELSLARIAPSKLLTKALARETIQSKVYRHHNALHELKMTRFLGEVEEKHRLVVFQADQRYTWWTRLCIAQADAILL